jgi:hypothetical protein
MRGEAKAKGTVSFRNMPIVRSFNAMWNHKSFKQLMMADGRADENINFLTIGN